jgi:hypothetical protein
VKVRLDREGIEPAEEYSFFYTKVIEDHHLETCCFLYIRNISEVKGVEIVSDRISYIILRGRWFHIIGLNVYAPTVGKVDDVKDDFYE